MQKVFRFLLFKKLLICGTTQSETQINIKGTSCNQLPEKCITIRINSF